MFRFAHSNRRLLHYNTTNAIFLLAPVVLLSGEMAFLYEVHFLAEAKFWGIMTFTGVTGFLINIAVFLQIKYTTPLTNTISGTAKACFQTGLAWAIWQNEITSMVLSMSLICWINCVEWLRNSLVLIWIRSLLIRSL